MHNKKAFTLLEVLLYSLILGIILAILTSILTLGIKVQITQTASNELANQLNFSMQTIQRLIRKSSSVTFKNSACNDNDFPTVPTVLVSPSPPTLSQTPMDLDDLPLVGGESGGSYRCLILHTEKEGDPLNPPALGLPTYIWAEPKAGCTTDPCEGEIKIKEGSASRVAFTSDSVSCNYSANAVNTCLTFGKFEDYPGHKIVRVSLALTQNTSPPITRALVTTVSRASAATFDSPLFPTTNNLWDLGSATYRWKDLFLSRNLSVGKFFTEPQNYNAGDRGYKMIGYSDPNTCTNICQSHSMICAGRARFVPSFAWFLNDNVGPNECSVSLNEVGMCACFNYSTP